MEKVKDFLHDFSDIFFALIIAGIMFAVLTINLGSWFNESLHSVSADEPDNASINRDNNFKDDKPDNNIINDEKGQPETENDINETEVEEPENNTHPDTGENEQKIEVTETKKIFIPDGTFCTGIAKILKDNSLIDNENDFIQAAENLRLSGRLKSGSFEIPVNTTVEDIARIIAGQKKI